MSDRPSRSRGLLAGAAGACPAPRAGGRPRRVVERRDRLARRPRDLHRRRARTARSQLDHEQVANAATIAAVAHRRDLPSRAVTVGLATAMQESELRNLDGGDHDSAGLFQQRPSQGWGSFDQVTDPVYASRGASSRR